MSWVGYGNLTLHGILAYSLMQLGDGEREREVADEGEEEEGRGDRITKPLRVKVILNAHICFFVV